jgi:hypothetical protein
MRAITAGSRACGLHRSNFFDARYSVSTSVQDIPVYRFDRQKIAHSTPGSNSGNLAPRAFFPTLGLNPVAEIFKLVVA